MPILDGEEAPFYPDLRRMYPIESTQNGDHIFEADSTTPLGSDTEMPLSQSERGDRKMATARLNWWVIDFGSRERPNREAQRTKSDDHYDATHSHLLL